MVCSRWPTRPRNRWGSITSPSPSIGGHWTGEWLCRWCSLTHGPSTSWFTCSCVSLTPPVFLRWVVSSAKKEDTDEDIAKYDGKSTSSTSFGATVLEPWQMCVLWLGKWAVEEMKDSKLPGDKGLVLKSRAKHHAISTLLLRPFTFNTKPLIVQ